jgi:RimJ/RimL family protein N-acetyltransferase
LAPPRTLILDGLYARLEPLSAETHAALLYRAYDGHPEVWTYMPVGPFSSSAQFHRWTRDAQDSQDPQFLAIYNKDSGAFEGVMSYLRINTDAGSIEIGFISMSPALQRTRAATEAIFLTMKWAFENGYRRFEWKCDSCNRPSRAAAQRFGLSFEGVFRQHMVVKGRNRDTAWFAAIDTEWSALREAYMTWLAPTNFDSSGQQIERLSDLTKLVRVTEDPALRD